ncbi:MAG: glutamyl-tRNA reductase, partial [Acidobacteriota bacterium]
AREIFGSLQGKRALVIGAGKMADSAARHLRRAGVSEILVTNRTRERAVTMAEDCGGRVIDYETFQDVVPAVDIVLASSGAPHFILTRDQMRAAIAKRRNAPMFLIDIAVPRNIEPSAGELDGVFLYDIDDLGRHVDTNVKARIQVAKEAEDIIGEEVERMVVRLKTREVGPTIEILKSQFENWRKGEIDRQRTKLGELTPQQEEALEAITRGLVNKIAHGPIAELRQQATDPGGVQVLNFIRRVFRLNE